MKWINTALSDRGSEGVDRYCTITNHKRQITNGHIASKTKQKARGWGGGSTPCAGRKFSRYVSEPDTP